MPEKDKGKLVNDQRDAEIERHYMAALAQISEKIANGADPSTNVDAMLRLTEVIQSGRAGLLQKIDGRLTTIENDIRNLNNRMNLERKK